MERHIHVVKFGMCLALLFLALILLFMRLIFFHHKAVPYVDVQTTHEPPSYIFALTVFQI